MGTGLISHIAAGLDPLLSLPGQSWLLLLAGAVLLVVGWSAMQWLGELIERGRYNPSTFTAKHSTDSYVLLSEADWPRGAISKKTNVLIRHRADGGLRSTKQTIRYTTHGDYPGGTVGLPPRANADLGLDFETVLEKCDLEITPTQRFIGEALWNHADDSIRISTRTTFWVTLFTTVFSTATGILTSWWFR